jgi:hypothetical protein
MYDGTSIHTKIYQNKNSLLCLLCGMNKLILMSCEQIFCNATNRLQHNKSSATRQIGCKNTNNCLQHFKLFSATLLIVSNTSNLLQHNKSSATLQIVCHTLSLVEQFKSSATLQIVCNTANLLYISGIPVVFFYLSIM